MKAVIAQADAQEITFVDLSDEQVELLKFQESRGVNLHEQMRVSLVGNQLMGIKAKVLE